MIFVNHNNLATLYNVVTLANFLWAEGNVDEMNASYQNETKVKV